MVYEREIPPLQWGNAELGTYGNYGPLRMPPWEASARYCGLIDEDRSGPVGH
jgi:hypothetical protein